MTKQKSVFLDGEGDAWIRRNLKIRSLIFDVESDRLAVKIMALAEQYHAWDQVPAVLEVGCADGLRLGALANRIAIKPFGIDPSSEAIAAASAKGIVARQGTADELPFDSGSIDILVFGFCLYLCDPEDLFLIAKEADRVLAPSGWIVINDFYSSYPRKRDYHHRPGVQSHKMDYRQLFQWHPSYECYSHEVYHHADQSLTDDPEEWVAVSVMRKA